MNISLFHNIYRVIIFICRIADEKQTYKNSLVSDAQSDREYG